MPTFRTVDQDRLAGLEGRGALEGKPPRQGNGSDALAFEATLWRSADALRGNLESAEYKRVVLGLIYFKYIFNAFKERHTRFPAESNEGVDARYIGSSA